MAIDLIINVRFWLESLEELVSSNDAVLKEKEQQARHLEDKGQQLQNEVRSRS